MAMEKMLDWTNEFTFEFLEMYKEEAAIWDPTHPDHKKKEKVIAAWVRMSDRTGKPVQELKRKKDSLMATFRMHWRRKKASIQALAPGRKIYKPVWFAYEYMDGFLGPLYKCDDLPMPDCSDAPETLPTEETNEVQSETATPSSSTGPRKRRRKKPPERHEAKNPTENNSACPETDASESCDQQDDDECVLYGNILAKRLRRLPPFDRQLLMHDIDGLVLECMQRHLQSQVDTSSSVSWHSTAP